MKRVKVGRTGSVRITPDTEIARLRDLDVSELRASWTKIFRQQSPTHLSRHLLFRVLVYRLQADRFGDLDDKSQRILDRGSPEGSAQRALNSCQRLVNLKPGTMLGREWKGRMHRVAVLPEGFAWNGESYRSLSKVAFAITGTHWNGPLFFGLRDKLSKEVRQ